MLQGINEDLALPLLAPRRKIVRKEDRSSITGNVVVVTGAGGSIGSELVTQIAEAGPKKLILIDNSEFNLYEVNCTLAESHVGARVPLLADVRSASTMAAIFAEFMPNIVFHAAALKHVPLMENDHNFIEAAHTNIIGTMNVARMCKATGSRMVFISTDKAVEPTSVMGLTKRVAELLLQGFARAHNLSGMAHVRFGNVMGSSGSVVPLFRRQIAHGGPVTVTHKDMTRYMMTISQAVDLVLEAADIQQDSKDYGMYVFNMGKPIRIYDLAISLIEQAGFEPYRDIDVKIIGIRPGEKLEERVVYPDEVMTPTKSAKVFRRECVTAAQQFGVRPEVIEAIADAVTMRNTARLKKLLRQAVPEFNGVWQ